MIVEIGAQVIGKNGKLGEVKGFSIDRNSQSADQIVIKHGLLGSDERLAVLGHVVGVETGTVRVNLTQEDLDRLERYDVDAYRSSDIVDRGVILSDRQADQRYTSALDLTRANPPVAGDSNTPINDTHRMTPTYPAGNAVTPEDKRPIVISEGTEVWDNTGEKIGEVSQVAVETTTGEPTLLLLKQGGLLSTSKVELPVDWIESFSPRGIFLNVAGEEVKGLSKRTN